MCGDLERKIKEAQKVLDALLEVAKNTVRPTKTVKYRLVEEAGSRHWWDVEEFVNCRWIHIGVISADCENEAKQRFEDEFLRKRKVFEYTCEQYC